MDHIAWAKAVGWEMPKGLNEEEIEDTVFIDENDQIFNKLFRR